MIYTEQSVKLFFPKSIPFSESEQLKDYLEELILEGYTIGQIVPKVNSDNRLMNAVIIVTKQHDSEMITVKNPNIGT